MPGVRGRTGRPTACSKPLKTRRRLPRPCLSPFYLTQRHCCDQSRGASRVEPEGCHASQTPTPSGPPVSSRPPIKQSQWEADERQWSNATPSCRWERLGARRGRGKGMGAPHRGSSLGESRDRCVPTAPRGRTVLAGQVGDRWPKETSSPNPVSTKSVTTMSSALSFAIQSSQA